jgi:hypothetical protein
MPAHEIGKRFDLARRFNHPQTHHRRGDLGQLARDRQDQIGFGDGEDRGQKERKSQRGPPLCAQLRQRSIHRSLSTIQRFDDRVRQLQILFERKTTGTNRLSGPNNTDEI